MTSILENLILSLVNPVGFVISILLIIFFEYLILKSIIKDENTIILKKIILNYIKNYRNHVLELEDEPLTSPQLKILDITFKNENISAKEIAERTGIKIGAARKLISDLVSKGYIIRKANASDKRKFSFSTSDKYKRRRNYNLIKGEFNF